MMLVVKNPPANVGDVRDAGLTPGLGRFPGGRCGNPLPVFLSGKVAKSQIQLSNLASTQGRKKTREGLGLLLLHPRPLRGKPWRGVTPWPKFRGADAGWAGSLTRALQAPASSQDLHSDSARSLVNTTNLN